MLSVTRESLWTVLGDVFEREYENAVVYGDEEKETGLHEGTVRILPNGWVEVSPDRLLSPEAVHHLDRRPAEEG